METQKIFIGGRQNVNTNEVLSLKADINYTTVFFQNEQPKIIVATTLKTLEERLLEYPNFCRVTKNTIINLDCVDYVQENNIFLHNGEQIKPSRRRVKYFQGKYLALRKV
jgi:DNA-binding LytR/AlgR family response regulator